MTLHYIVTRKDHGVMKRVLLFACMLAWICVSALAEAPVRNCSKITCETHVFTWSFKEQEWSKGQLIKVLVQQFSKDNKLVSEELSDGKNGILEKIIYSYGPEGTIKSFFNAGNKLIRTSAITLKGDTETEIVKRIDGSIFQQYVTKKDNSGKILQISHMDAAGKLVFRKDHVYDSRGFLTYIRLFNPDNTLAVEIRYEYKKFDTDGNWLVREEYYAYGDVGNRPHEIVTRKME